MNHYNQIFIPEGTALVNNNNTNDDMMMIIILLPEG